METYQPTERLTAFVRESQERHPIERKAIKKVVKALRDAGTPVHHVWDTEDNTLASKTQDVLDLAFNLDEVWLMTADDSWVRLTMGEGVDVICDYTTDLEVALAPVFAWLERQEDY